MSHSECVFTCVGCDFGRAKRIRAFVARDPELSGHKCENLWLWKALMCASNDAGDVAGLGDGCYSDGAARRGLRARGDGVA